MCILGIVWIALELHWSCMELNGNCMEIIGVAWIAWELLYGDYWSLHRVALKLYGEHWSCTGVVQMTLE
jgi:hypothetical protein